MKQISALVILLGFLLVFSYQSIAEVLLRDAKTLNKGSSIFTTSYYYYEYKDPEEIMYIKNKDGKMSTLALGMHSLREYGLRYEASKIDKVNYISDSNGFFRLNEKEVKPANAKKALVEFLNTVKGKTILLAHPIYWNI